jgi:hypothetical protein
VSTSGKLYERGGSKAIVIEKIEAQKQHSSKGLLKTKPARSGRFGHVWQPIGINWDKGFTPRCSSTSEALSQPKAAPRPLYIPGTKTRIPAEPVICERICGST